MNIKDYETLEAMKYFDRPDDDALSEALLVKKYNMINNKDHLYMATQKWDGYWMMYIKEEDGTMLIRGRNKNVAGGYENYAMKLPHIVELMKSWPNNTVVLGEICWPELGKVATDVGVILRCLPDKAIARQEHKKLIVKAFDILMYNNVDCQNDGYETRFHLLEKVMPTLSNSPYFSITRVCYDDFLGFADTIIQNKGEGCVIYERTAPYASGKSPAWKSLKLKQHLDSQVYKVVGLLEPKREYSGKELDTWQYWACYTENNQSHVIFTHKPTEEELRPYSLVLPITRPYALGWKAGVTIELPSGKYCDVASGTSDSMKEWLASDEAATLLAKGQLFAHVRAMQEATLGGLRHPVFEDIEFNKDIDR